MEKKSLFIEKILTFMNGENNETIAKKIQIKAISYLNAAISQYDIMLLQADEKIESVREDLNKALINKGSTEFTDYYVSNIITCQSALQDAIKNKENIEKTKKFLKQQLDIVKS